MNKSIYTVVIVLLVILIMMVLVFDKCDETESNRNYIIVDEMASNYWNRSICVKIDRCACAFCNLFDHTYAIAIANRGESDLYE